MNFCLGAVGNNQVKPTHTWVKQTPGTYYTDSRPKNFCSSIDSLYETQKSESCQQYNYKGRGIDMESKSKKQLEGENILRVQRLSAIIVLVYFSLFC